MWKESMKPDQRQVEREGLQRLQSKAEYKRNPRFVPPLKSGLTKSNKEKTKKKLDVEKESKYVCSMLGCSAGVSITFFISGFQWWNRRLWQQKGPSRGGSGAICSPRKIWNLVARKCNFQHSMNQKECCWWLCLLTKEQVLWTNY